MLKEEELSDGYDDYEPLMVAYDYFSDAKDSVEGEGCRVWKELCGADHCCRVWKELCGADHLSHINSVGLCNEQC